MARHVFHWRLRSYARLLYDSYRWLRRRWHWRSRDVRGWLHTHIPHRVTQTRFFRRIQHAQLRAAVPWDTYLRTEPCVYCGRSLDFVKMTIEHVIPKSQGGLDKSTNKVGCCQTCNRDRGSLPLCLYLMMRLGHWPKTAEETHVARRLKAPRRFMPKRHLPTREEPVPIPARYVQPPLRATLDEMVVERAMMRAKALADLDRRRRSGTDVDLRRRRVN